jgi:integrase
MARPRTQSIKLPPHVHCVKARGKPYYYLQRNRGTGKATERVRLPDDPRTPDWWDEYRRLMHLPPPTIKADSFEHVIKTYLDSPDFKELADATRSGYERYLGIVRDKWGSLEIKGLEPRHVLALRDRYQATPATANAIVRTLSALMVWAIPRGHRPDNPCLHIKKLKTGDGWGPWPWEMIELVEKHAPRWMWHAAALALYTGQRESDVLAMTWTQARGGMIELRQQKTGRQLVIPAHQRLLAVLATIPRRTVQILSSSRGEPWTPGGFRSSWLANLKGPLAPIREGGFVFHGLRKSAVVTLLEAGCTDAETAAITGQSRQMIEHYSRQVNQRKLAAAAILKWERSQNEGL